jgi:NAD-dependent DNA ligase
MDIKGTKENTLEKIYNEGLMTTIKDLFTMDYNDVSNVVGEKTALNLKKAVESKTYFDYEILGSLMIDGIGIESSKVIMKNYTIDDIIDMKKKSVIIENISQLEGFSKIKAKSFAEGLIQNIKLIKFLKSRKENYKVLKDVLKENNVSSVDSMKIVFTGFRDPALQNKLEMMGHKVTSSVSGKTSILVHNGDPGATKIEAAKKNGTKIMMLNEFKKFMNIE